MDSIDKTIEFCADFEPDFRSGLRGSSAQDIARLEQERGRACSTLHRKFLHVMGESTGSVSLGPYSTAARDLADQGSEALGMLPDDVELFAVPVTDEDTDIFLVEVRDAPPEVAAHPTVNAATRPFAHAELDTLAGSLEQLLCLPMLNRCHVLKLPFRGIFVASELELDYLAHARATGAELKSTEWWFSGGSAYVARRGSAVLVAKQTRTSYFSLGIAAADRREMSQVFDFFRHAFADAELPLEWTE